LRRVCALVSPTILVLEVVDEGFSYASKPPTIKLESDDKVISRIAKFDWQKSFVEGQMNNYVFDVAGAMCEYGVAQSIAETWIMTNIVNGNCKDEKSKLNSIKSAYSTRDENSKYFEDYDKVARVKSDLKNGKDYVLKTHKITEETYEILKEEKELPQFWFLDKKGDVKINAYKYKLFLEGKGFKKYFPKGSLKPTWVYVKSNIVRETSIELIKDYVLNYLLRKQEFSVWKLCVNYHLLFNESYLLMLESKELPMLRDEKNKSFIVYENGILEVKIGRAHV
jgi:hypothetical protein